MVAEDKVGIICRRVKVSKTEDAGIGDAGLGSVFEWGSFSGTFAAMP